MKVGIYGGSFNPVHNGHVGIAKKAIEAFGLDRLIVIPAFVSPFKTNNREVPPYDRLELVKLAFAGIPKVVIDDRELRRGGVSYSVDTVREIRAEYEKSIRESGVDGVADDRHEGLELIFLVGEDSVAGLPRWKDYDELVRLCTFRSFERTPESSTEVRRRLASGEPIDDLVPAAVAKAIGAASVR